ncbi:hypothetical protein GGTG_11418 [Gaeumannomyces tritici R3-111a-1]|uniref:Uncharacterized protein n=1 Tax=Gaeumannomyces tritici (strain R3-111a-1) TaxID=644352 RepID=J3PD49_GAET3|nr:hypothetical protein GGTG_11418 [Gaeumannomyces tritici R3-111a-1]EJT70394.1 hypothetical protein GGTG_11418 [Gaeumannomyces tritici R3-111a-1]
MLSALNSFAISYTPSNPLLATPWCYKLVLHDILTVEYRYSPPMSSVWRYTGLASQDQRLPRTPSNTKHARKKPLPRVPSPPLLNKQSHALVAPMSSPPYLLVCSPHGSSDLDSSIPFSEPPYARPVPALTQSHSSQDAPRGAARRVDQTRLPTPSPGEKAERALLFDHLPPHALGHTLLDSQGTPAHWLAGNHPRYEPPLGKTGWRKHIYGTASGPKRRAHAWSPLVARLAPRAAGRSPMARPINRNVQPMCVHVGVVGVLRLSALGALTVPKCYRSARAVLK